MLIYSCHWRMTAFALRFLFWVLGGNEKRKGRGHSLEGRHFIFESAVRGEMYCCIFHSFVLSLRKIQ
jgi:hypothetical protein